MIVNNPSLSLIKKRTRHCATINFRESLTRKQICALSRDLGDVIVAIICAGAKHEPVYLEIQFQWEWIVRVRRKWIEQFHCACIVSLVGCIQNGEKKTFSCLTSIISTHPPAQASGRWFEAMAMAWDAITALVNFLWPTNALITENSIVWCSCRFALYVK